MRRRLNTNKQLDRRPSMCTPSMFRPVAVRRGSSNSRAQAPGSYQPSPVHDAVIFRLEIFSGSMRQPSLLFPSPSLASLVDSRAGGWRCVEPKPDIDRTFPPPVRSGRGSTQFEQVAVEREVEPPPAAGDPVAPLPSTETIE
jgi:hypothetical protein